MNNQKPKIHCILAADSRARNFPTDTAINAHMYAAHYIIQRGAIVADLKPKILNLVQSSPPEDIISIKIAAGINECTYREGKFRYTELIPNNSIHVLQNLLNLKTEIRQCTRRALVSFATIPIVSFKSCQSHYIKTGRLIFPRYNSSDLLEFQEDLSQTLSQINDRLMSENKKPQEIEDVGEVYPALLLWHLDIEKEAVLRIQGEKITRKRIPSTALSDGMHPSDKISEKWFSNLHKSYVKEWERINNPYTFHGK